MSPGLTPQQQEALDELWEILRRPSRRHHLRAIRLVLESAPPAAVVPTLAALYWASRKDALLRTCGQLLLHHFPRIPVDNLPRIDEKIRSWLHRFSGSDQHLARLAPNSTTRGNDPVWPWIAACHPSGYIRQKAIRQLATRSDQLSIALLLVRANDWVSHVATPAIKAADAKLSDLAPTQRLLLLPLLDRLGHCLRFRQKNSAITQYLTKDLPWDAWLNAFQTGDRHQRRILSRLAGSKARASTSPIPVSVTRTLVQCDDPVIIIQALRKLLPNDPDGCLPLMLPELAGSRWPPVRREAIRIMIRVDPADARGRLITLLTDRSRTMRSFARYHLAESLPVDAPDFRQHYLDQLADPRKQPWALRGLAEVDPDRAHLEALRHLDGPSLAIRKAAVESLKADALPDFLELLLQNLESSEPGLVRSAFIQLRKVSHLLSAEDLCQRAPRSTRPQVILQLVQLLSKWERLEGLLLLSAHEDLRSQAVARLSNWFRQQNNSWIVLSSDTLDRLRTHLQKITPLLPNDLTQEISFVLQQETRA